MLIQKLRLQRGWSQEQLAELSGLSARTIQRLERGQPASLETLKALGAAFDVDVSTLKEPDMSPTAARAAYACDVAYGAYYLHSISDAISGRSFPWWAGGLASQSMGCGSLA